MVKKKKRKHKAYDDYIIRLHPKLLLEFNNKLVTVACLEILAVFSMDFGNKKRKKTYKNQIRH